MNSSSHYDNTMTISAIKVNTGNVKCLKSKLVSVIISNGTTTCEILHNQATTPFDYCPCTAFLLVQPHCMNARWNRCQEDLNSYPWRTGGDHQHTLVPRGWRLSSTTWKPITCPWMKQLTWLRIVHSGDWYLSLVLCTPNGAYQKRMNKWMNDYLSQQIQTCFLSTFPHAHSDTGACVNNDDTSKAVSGCNKTSVMWRDDGLPSASLIIQTKPNKHIAAYHCVQALQRIYCTGIHISLTWNVWNVNVFQNIWIQLS